MADFPKGAHQPDEDDIVQIIMPEKVARAIERDFLVPRSNLRLSPPLLFGEDDVPSYILELPELPWEGRKGI